VQFNLAADMVLIYGPNGYGKTSTSEAIEWLVYGGTHRRLRGETYSRAEYADTYRNVHGGHPTEVSARVRLANGSEVELLRRLDVGVAEEQSVVYIDGTATSFERRGFVFPSAVYPIIAQHGLQDFIHSRPKERRDAVSAALGLEDLTAFKTSLDGARRSFNATPPQAVSDARRTLAPLAATLATIPETEKLASRWQRSPMEVDTVLDIAALIMAGQALTQTSITRTSELLGALRAKRVQVSRSVFDDTKIAPRGSVETLLAHAETTIGSARTYLEEVKASVDVCLGTSASHAAELLTFWATGLRLAPAGTQCPMCEAPTMASDVRETLRQRVTNAQEVTGATTRLQNAIRDARTAMERISQLVAQGTPPPLEGDAASLLALLSDAAPAVRVFLSLHEAVTTTAAAINETLQGVRRYLDDLPNQVADPSRASQVAAASSEAPANVSQVTTVYVAALGAHAGAWGAFRQLLDERVASRTEVVRIDAVGKALAGQPLIRELTAYNSLLSASRTLLQITETQLQDSQQRLLVSRGAEVAEIYACLNPSADVGFERMEPATDQLKLHARSYGVRMSAAANLSECQLNCLGLAFWVMRATTPSSPFGFIVLDDPIQSMDDDHTEAFLGSLIPYLLDSHKKQVILLSHVRRFIERARELYGARSVRLYHLESYGRAGPSLVEQVKLAQMLSEIKGLSGGNEANRELAVDRLRVLVEQTIRSLHMKSVGTAAPPKYDRATPKELLELFRTLEVTTPDEHARLRDTVQFADPAHHTEVGYTVPLQNNIQPHIDRLEGLLKKYELVS
jgi:hypothetical protein